MSTQNHQTHKRSPYRILPALGVVLALGMASSILSGFPRVAVAQAASAVSTDADQAYAAALHEYDHADPNQDNYLDLFHKQLKLAEENRQQSKEIEQRATELQQTESKLKQAQRALTLSQE